MDNRTQELAQIADEIKERVENNNLSRRDAIKLGAALSALMVLNPTTASAVSEAKASSAKGKIVIVGGGAAGITMAAQLTKALSSPDITIIEPNEMHHYQPGYTLIAAGVWQPSDVEVKTADYIPSGVKWLKTKVTEYQPDNNLVVTETGEKIGYDVLVVCPGIVLDYEGYAGMSKELVTTAGNGIASIYFRDGAVATWQKLQDFAKKGGEAIFSDGTTPIKCGGAPKKIQYLTDGHMKKVGTRDKANLTFYTAGGKMFGVPEYHEAIVKQYEARKMGFNYNHKLVAVDATKKIATFDKSYEVEEIDPVLNEKVKVKKTEKIEKPFDFLHVVPKMRTPKEFKDSELAGKIDFGGALVDAKTLQHQKYKNVFGLGDAAAVPLGKTGGTVRKQAPVVTANIVSFLEQKELKAQFDGYTVCPLITGYGTVMMAEFKYENKLAPSFPLDPTQERWIWWFMKVYMLKPMYFYGMLRGRA